MSQPESPRSGGFTILTLPSGMETILIDDGPGTEADIDRTPGR